MDELIDFIIKNGEGRYSRIDTNKLKNEICKHIEYRTFLVIRDPGGIVAVGRWNWLDGETIHVLDLIIRKDVRCLKALKALIILGLQANPSFEYVVFERLGKYPDRKQRKYKVKDFLRGGIK